MPRYDHAYTIAFSLESNHPTGEDVTSEMLKTAWLHRMNNLDESDCWVEAAGAPYDSYEIEEPVDPQPTPQIST